MTASLARIALLIVVTPALWAAARLSLEHADTGATCPTIGPAPACFIIAAGYALIALSAFAPGLRAAVAAFAAGWVPVALLAAIGSVLEITNGPTCPRAFGATPQCFISLAIAAAAFVLFAVFALGRPKSTA